MGVCEIVVIANRVTHDDIVDEIDVTRSRGSCAAHVDGLKTVGRDLRVGHSQCVREVGGCRAGNPLILVGKVDFKVVEKYCRRCAMDPNLSTYTDRKRVW